MLGVLFTRQFVLGPANTKARGPELLCPCGPDITGIRAQFPGAVRMLEEACPAALLPTRGPEMMQPQGDTEHKNLSHLEKRPRTAADPPRRFG